MRRLRGSVKAGRPKGAPATPIDWRSEMAPLVARARASAKTDDPVVVEDFMMRQVAEDLVVRARAGEQIAASIIQLTAENAKTGDPRSVRAKRYIEEAIKEPPFNTRVAQQVVHPMAHKALTAVVAGESEAYGRNIVKVLPRAGWRGIVTLANGPSLLKSGRVRQVAQALSTADEKNAFCQGRKYCGMGVPEIRRRLPEAVQKALDLGDRYGLAQKLQAVRLPGSRISDFDPATGWELGE